MSKRIPIIELYGPTIQGEGMLIGHPTHFLRTGGCGYKCAWCDSMHAVDPQQVKANRTMMSVEEIVRRIDTLPRAPWLTLTGGDPCLHEELGNIVGLMWHRDVRVCVETQGELWPEWLRSVDAVTFSPKGPSSKNITDVAEFRDNLVKYRQHSRSKVAIKVVVFTQSDLEYASNVYNEVRPRVGAPLYDKFYFQVGSPLLSDSPDFPENELRESLLADWMRGSILTRYHWLVEALLEHVDELDENTAITPQVHTLLWPTEARGR